MAKNLVVKHLEAKRVTPADGKNYFFGYFDKNHWNGKQQRLLAHRADFTGRQVRFGDIAEVGILENGNFTKVGQTRSWCWQQGAMLQWFDDDHIIYNDFEDNGFISRIVDLRTGDERKLCRAIYCLSPDRKYALSLDFARLDRERPGYGYPGVWTEVLEHGWPDNDGIWRVDIENNTAELIISIGQIVREFNREGMDQSTSWFNHILISPDSKRFAFFHRWRKFGPWGPGVRSHVTHMFTADPDGSDIYPLNLEDMSSHYAWISPTQIINYSNRYKDGWQYHLFTDKSDRVETLGDKYFDDDGHCTFSPDHRWMLTDSYPDRLDNCRALYLYDVKRDIAYEIGRFYADPSYDGPARCDLHPSFSADGKTICFDSIHEGFRGIYNVDLTRFLAQADQ
ncbi:MAG: hypothetical protein E7043_09345 [Lentisphaerae bacterium]|nr:hypothetical protein [Lentisphaerota bacterium]